MLHELGLDEEFFSSLTALDAEIARRVAVEGCPRCGGPLHIANYPRKPRGGMMAAAAEAFTIRHSLCCGKEGCRRRALPPSLRFLGRRVYVEAVVLLASMTVQLAATWRVVRAATGVPRQTLRRWGAWWRGIFPRSATWELLRTRFAPPPPNETELPCSLVLRLHADLDGAGTGATMSAVCLLAARCLAPATTSSVPDGSRFVRG